MLERGTVQAVQEAIHAHARTLGEKLNIDGLEVRKGSCSYDPTAGTIRVTVTLAVATEDQEREAFERHCSLFHLKPEAYNAIIFVKGSQYRIVGFDLGRRKYPIVVRHSITGKRSLFVEGILAHVPEHLQTVGRKPIIELRVGDSRE